MFLLLFVFCFCFCHVLKLCSFNLQVHSAFSVVGYHDHGQDQDRKILPAPGNQSDCRIIRIVPAHYQRKIKFRYFIDLLLSLLMITT